MASDDRLLASWILIAGSIGVGLWYYRLHPYGQLRRVGQAAAAAATGTPAPAPVQPGTTPGYAIPGLNYGPPQFNPGSSGGHAGIGP